MIQPKMYHYNLPHVVSFLLDHGPRAVAAEMKVEGVFPTSFPLARKISTAF